MSDDTTEIALTEAGDQLATITTGHTIKRRPFRYLEGFYVIKL